MYFLSFADLWIRVPSREPLFFILPPAVRLLLSLARPTYHEAAGFRQPFDASSLFCVQPRRSPVYVLKASPTHHFSTVHSSPPGSKSSLVDILPYFQVRGSPKYYMSPVDPGAFPSSLSRTCPTSLYATTSPKGTFRLSPMTRGLQPVPSITAQLCATDLPYSNTLHSTWYCAIADEWLVSEGSLFMSECSHCERKRQHKRRIITEHDLKTAYRMLTSSHTDTYGFPSRIYDFHFLHDTIPTASVSYSAETTRSSLLAIRT